MDYPYELLDPERFQQFCQALLVREVPNVQCFPVGQPDAGRDAIARGFLLPGTFIVYQVKFVRNPFAEEDPHKWLIRVMEDEAPKLEKLVPQGASQFYLITNIRGTGHGDVGAIDRVNAILAQHLHIPGICWWRDDLNRRLDSAWALKWIYPELMTGPDLIRAIVEQGLTEDQIRRANAVSAYVRDQYERDREVRFKQVELQNLLLDLFIDVPVEPRGAVGRRQRTQVFHVWRNLSQAHQERYPAHARFVTWSGDYSGSREERSVEAAGMLLNAEVQSKLQNIVIEGAPGQGKSTVTQYVCQVHRMRTLKLESELQQLPAAHRSAAVRIPFKVDLRDLAAWLSKRDPFSAEENPPLPEQWAKTLESFLAAQVRHQSGGTAFSVDDLLAVAQVSALLFVFDGLDEVADISRRREVVDEITRGVSRLRENAVSIQVIVTSRPAAFANSPGMPETEYPYFSLASLTRASIEQYADKWLKARKLSAHDSGEFRRTLREKLDQPHLRDLARNPMQLAILLSLLQRRGASLPDKRTALYDSYIDVFLGRESEKSPVVREHRELLIDVHQYLAWRLQAEAELGKNTGSVTSERLQMLLREYLSRQGHDTELVDDLFQGMVERVFALVSRVQGTLNSRCSRSGSTFAPGIFMYQRPTHQQETRNGERWLTGLTR